MDNKDCDIIDSYIRINAKYHAAIRGISISEYLAKRRKEVDMQSDRLGISMTEYVELMMIARAGAEEYLTNIV